MREYVIPAPERVTVPVLGADALFPVRRIYCVGRNYAAHVREMGGDERQPPFFFQKPTDAIILGGNTVPYPTLTEDFQHEIELVLAIGRDGAHISIEDAADHVYGFATGIDFTRRDVQVEARKAGRPWEIGKAFDHSAAITPIQPRGDQPLPETGNDQHRGERADAAKRRPVRTDLAVRRSGLDPLHAQPPGGRRPHLHRHAGRRRAGGPGRSAGGPHRRPAAPRYSHRRETLSALLGDLACTNPA